MNQQDQIHDVIYGAIRDVQDMLPPGANLEETAETALLEGEGGSLDSLAVVNLMVALEARLEQEFSQAISLADALGLPPEESPFRTVSTLAEFVAQELGRSGND